MSFRGALILIRCSNGDDANAPVLDCSEGYERRDLIIGERDFDERGNIPSEAS